MDALSCGALRSRVPAFLDFSFTFCVPVRHFFVFPYAPAFLFRVPMLLQSTHRWVGSTCHRVTIPPHHVCAVYKYTGGKPVWGQTRVSSTIPHFHLSISTSHFLAISSQERKFVFPIRLRSVLCVPAFLYKICIPRCPCS